MTCKMGIFIQIWTGWQPQAQRSPERSRMGWEWFFSHDLHSDHVCPEYHQSASNERYGNCEQLVTVANDPHDAEYQGGGK